MDKLRRMGFGIEATVGGSVRRSQLSFTAPPDQTAYLLAHQGAAVPLDVLWHETAPATFIVVPGAQSAVVYDAWEWAQGRRLSVGIVTYSYPT